MTTLYIAGPMAGWPESNYPLFHATEDILREAGYEVINPARNGDGEDHEWAWYMRRSIPQVLAADGIALLPGWSSSRGARLERQIASAVGIPMSEVPYWIALAVSQRGKRGELMDRYARAHQAALDAKRAMAGGS